jgi:hypothetical protein
MRYSRNVQSVDDSRARARLDNLSAGIPHMEALGPVLILLSVPLLLRWVPRNRF